MKTLSILGLLLALGGMGCIDGTGPEVSGDGTMIDPDASVPAPEPDPDPDRSEAVGMYLQIGDETPTQLYELTVDADTFAEVVDAVGSVPEGLIEGQPSRDPGTRTVTPVVSSIADTVLFEGLSRSERGESTEALGEMRLIFGTTDPEPVAMLLPAVQPAREAAVRRNTATQQVEFALTFEVAKTASDTTVITYTGLENHAPEPPPPYLDVSGDVWAASPELSEEEQARHVVDMATDFAIAGELRFLRGADGELLLQPWTAGLETADAGDYAIWRESLAARSLVLDVSDDRGRVLHRFRLPRVAAPTDLDSGTMAASMGGYIKIGDIKGESTDASHETALFETRYPRFSGTAFDLARRQMGMLSTRSNAALISSWNDNREGIIDALHAASVNANEQEGLLCVVMMPSIGRMMLALQDGLDDGSIDDAPELRRALADYQEAFIDLGEPEYQSFVGGPLASGGPHAGVFDGNDAEVACGAIERIVTHFDDTDIVHVLTDERAIDLSGRARDVLTSGSARHFDRLVVELTEYLDALSADPGTEPSAAPIDALLVINRMNASLDRHQPLAASRYVLSDAIVSSYR